MKERMDKWMKGGKDIWREERKDERKDGYMNERRKGYMKGGKDIWREERRMKKRMDKWIDDLVMVF